LDAFTGGANLYTVRTYGDGPVLTAHKKPIKSGSLPHVV